MVLGCGVCQGGDYAEGGQATASTTMAAGTTAPMKPLPDVQEPRDHGAQVDKATPPRPRPSSVTAAAWTAPPRTRGGTPNGTVRPASRRGGGAAILAGRFLCGGNTRRLPHPLGERALAKPRRPHDPHSHPPDSHPPGRAWFSGRAGLSHIRHFNHLAAPRARRLSAHRGGQGPSRALIGPRGGRRKLPGLGE